MRKILFIGLILIPVLILIQVTPANAISKLHVDGKYIKNETNQIIFLKGVNKVEMADDPDGIWMGDTMWKTSKVIAELDFMKSWGINVIRVHQAVEHWKYNMSSPNAAIPHRQAVKQLLDLAAERGIYVIYDGYSVTDYWHGAEQDPLPYPPYQTSENASSVITSQQDFIDWWVSIASELKDYPNVIFELWNEPTGDDQAKQSWFNVSQRTINAIRATGAQNLIIFQWAMNNWVNLDFPPPSNTASTMDWVWQANINDPTGNLVYSTHIYRTYGAFHHSKPSYWRAWEYNEIQQAFQYFKFPEVTQSYPLIIGEIGANLAYTGTELDHELIAFNNSLTLFDEMNIHFIAFWWRNINIFRLLNDSVSFKPTSSGQIFINHINSTFNATTIPSQVSISGKLKDLSNNPIPATITLYNPGTNNMNLTAQTSGDGSYRLSALSGFYDIQYNINNFFIPNFWIKLNTLNITSDLKDLVNYVSGSSSENKISFTVGINNSQTVQTYSDKKPNRVLINSTTIPQVNSISELKNNTWFYDSAGKKLYIIISSLPPSKKVVFRTSHWLAASSPYGYDNMTNFILQLHASDMMIYFKDSDIAGWQWTRLNATVDFFLSKGFTIWLIIGKTTYTETADTPYSVQYVIDTFKGRVKGIMFDLFFSTTPTEATNWFIAKKQQLESNGMEAMYYHGDGASPDYGDSSTDVNATYLNNQGLIVFAWLQNDNSWKPKTFNLSHFWIDYDILNSSSGGGPTGRSYAEIWNWYQNNVIKADNLKASSGCEALTFMVYMQDSWPSSDSINAMVDVANDWIK